MTRHLMPILGIMYLIAYIDRQNVSFAKLQMVGDLGLSETVYGLGASLFFIGYFFFEVPSNVILSKVGARLWFARIMVSWGCVTLALAFTQNATMFYILRFLLGACEAGFFPGVLYILTIWVPWEYRGRLVGLFMGWSAIANAIGAPIGGMLLDADGTLGLRGWQWVFLFTAAPAILMGILTLFILPDGPDAAKFLTPDDKARIKAVLRSEDSKSTKVAHGSLLLALLDYRVLLIALSYVAFPLGAYGLSYWLPTVVKGFGVTNTVNGFLNVIPWICVAWALWWVPRHSAKVNEQSWHIAGPAFVGAIFLLASVFVSNHAVQFALLCVAAAGIFSAQPVFWSLPSTFLKGASAAAGFAVVNSVGNLGGFVAQTVVPWIKDQTHSDIAPMLFLAGCLAIGGVMVFVVKAILSQNLQAVAQAAE
ncbi:MAG TPA: MFS transporter [Aliidongia sp.]|nr:MFS transporter [Aliidongia sp.]